MSKIYSGFSDNNYILTSSLPSIINNCEIIFKAKFISTNHHNTLFNSINNSPYTSIENRYGNLPSFYLNGWITGSTSLDNNKVYWYRMIYDGNNYILYTIEDDNYDLNNLPSISNWVQQCFTSSNLVLDNRNFYIGRGYDSNEYWDGLIYECQIIINGSEWFNIQTSSTDGYYNTGCLISKIEGWTNFAKTNSRYLRTVNNFNPGTDDWEIDLVFQTGNNITSDLGLISIDNNYSFGIATKDNKMRYNLSSNGSQWTKQSAGTYNIKTFTKYYMKFIYTYSDSTFTALISEDGINYMTDFTDSNGILSIDSFLKWGLGRNGDGPFSGIISIKSTKIYINGNLWFDGSTAVENIDYNIVGSPTYIDKPNIAMNFSSSNYIKLNPIKPNFGTKQSFRVILRAYYTNPNHQYLLSRSSDYDRSIFVRNDNAIELFGGTDIYVGSLNPNNWYWIGYEWNGLHYTLYYMLDNGKYNSYKQLPSFFHNDWIKSTTFEDSTNIFSSGFTLGYNVPYNDGNRYWRGMIDLNNCIFGNNVINYDVGKEGYITQSNCKTIDQNTTDNITLVQGIKLTIVPDQADAKVILWANEYKQTPNTNTLTAVEGTKVYYKVSKSKYKPVNGFYTLSSSDHVINVTMELSPVGEDPQWTTGSWSSIDFMPIEENAVYGLRGTCTAIHSGETSTDTAVLTDRSTSTIQFDSNAILTYTFDNPINILEIRLYSAWDRYRDGINIKSITYKNSLNVVKTIANSSIDYDSNTGKSYVYLKDSVEGCYIADDVISLTVNFGPQDTGYTAYAEFEVRKG